MFLENDFHFINAITYIDQVFNQFAFLHFKVDANIEVGGDCFNKFVKFDNRIVENNLRLIETYLPEILFTIAKECDSRVSIHKAIWQLSKKGYLHHEAAFAKILLKRKMYYFFEAIFFADIITQVWNGKWEQRSYVIKENEGLKYYQMYNIPDLILPLMKSLSFSLLQRDGKASNTYTVGLTNIRNKLRLA